MTLKNSTKNSLLIMIKLLAIGFIMLLLLIPKEMINSLVREREMRRDEAVSEVSYKWGNPQTLIGPILTIPYKQEVRIKKDGKEEVSERINYAHFLPEELEIKGEVLPKLLNRGIYEIAVYNTLLNFFGEFNYPEFAQWDIPEENIFWKDAVLSIGILDMRGIKEDIKINWNGQEFNASSGIKLKLDANSDYDSLRGEEFIKPESFVMPAPAGDRVLNSGVSADVIMPGDKKSGKLSYSFDLNLNGSQRLSFVPLGSETKVELASKWQNPSFDGAFLPDERTVDEKGFNAQWKILKLNRNFSQNWIGELNNNVIDSNFGVNFLIPVDDYQKNTRSIKYAILLIVLTFLIFFFVEMINKIRIHPIQYILVGLAILLFFTLLLSITEHLNFNLAYLIASAATLIIVGLYSKNIFKNNRLTLIQTGVLALMYLFIFTLIQLQDFALLIGSIGLFVILAAVMFISRKIDWYAAGAKDISDEDN